MGSIKPTEFSSQLTALNSASPLSKIAHQKQVSFGKGFIWKRGLFKKMKFLETLEMFRVSREPQECEKSARSPPFPGDSRELRDSSDQEDTFWNDPFLEPRKKQYCDRLTVSQTHFPTCESSGGEFVGKISHAIRQSGCQPLFYAQGLWFFLIQKVNRPCSVGLTRL